MAEPSNPNFKDDLHAFRTGLILGHLLKAKIRVVPDLDDDDNYTDIMTITLADDEENVLEVRVRVLP